MLVKVCMICRKIKGFEDAKGYEHLIDKQETELQDTALWNERSHGLWDCECGKNL